MATQKTDAGRECVALGECRPPHLSKKDMKRWCRGKVGVEHRWVWVSGRARSVGDGELGYRREHEVCELCQRERNAYWWWSDEKVRCRCHCGALMVKRAPSAEHVAKWGLARANRYGHTIMECLECAYEPFDAVCEVYRNGRMEKEYKRRPCRCEIVAAKHAKRLHYERRFALAAVDPHVESDGTPSTRDA